MGLSFTKKLILLIAAITITSFALIITSTRSKAAPQNVDGQVTQNDCLGMDGNYQGDFCMVHDATFAVFK